MRGILRPKTLTAPRRSDVQCLSFPTFIEREACPPGLREALRWLGRHVVRQEDRAGRVSRNSSDGLETASAAADVRSELIAAEREYIYQLFARGQDHRRGAPPHGARARSGGGTAAFACPIVPPSGHCAGSRSVGPIEAERLGFGLRAVCTCRHGVSRSNSAAHILLAKSGRVILRRNDKRGNADEDYAG
jgi:hypothetical protein